MQHPMVPDLLSDALRQTRLAGGVFLEAAFTAPWSITAAVAPKDCAPFMPLPHQIVAYHVIVRGALSVAVDGEPVVKLDAGDVVLLPRNDVHVLSSTPGLAPVRPDALVLPPEGGTLMRLNHGGGGDATHIYCGFLASQDAFNPLIAALPRIMKLSAGQLASFDWIEASMRFAIDELMQGRVANSDTMSRLSELLLVEAVRAYAKVAHETDAGWMRGLGDPQIGRALVALHGNIRKPWTAEELAQCAGLSRTAFMQRFATMVGVPPFRYLAQWRMRTARLNLAETQHSIAQIAYDVGYESEEAFSRAFKRTTGLAPGQWRNKNRSQ